jgi:hypothetical protein
VAGKYEKNIITDFRPEPDRPKFYGNEDRKKIWTTLLLV